MKIYDHKKIEEKWRQIWLEEKVYQPSLAKDQGKPKYYNLMMFPYPSAEGLHVGNMYAFTGADIHGRLKRMQGYDVFEPIGLDGFGIHSENYAIKVGKHPAEQAKISEAHFYDQLSKIGNGFAWDNRLETYDPDYYRWTQWLFVKMFKAGLAYRKKAQVNWCPSCKTVLSDEQVEVGVCERCKTPVEKRENEQWFFRITKYAQRLLDNIEKIDWPEKIKIAQRNWIGRREGINITYKIKGTDKTVTVFTTRPDTNFGATFVVVGVEHPLAQELGKKNKVIRAYIEKTLKRSEIDRIAEGRKKTGVFIGLYAINDLNNREMPIYVTDFVLGGVGTGAVVGVPGHDERDFEFAKEFDLEVIRVVEGADGDKSEITNLEQVQEDEGRMMNSGFLNGLDIHEATKKIMDYLEEKGIGKRVVEYKLRDWCISRQRYWGPPIPIIYCRKCWETKNLELKAKNLHEAEIDGEKYIAYAVPEDQLPVVLPEVKDWRPTGDGKSPLSKASRQWLEVNCPECGGKARRETDVSDTFLDSAWYFLRYPSIGEDKSDKTNRTDGTESQELPWQPELTRYWLPVDAYIGGAEHAVLHLMYSRFVWMVLRDLGYLPGGESSASNGGPTDRGWDEPFPFLFGHGLIIKDGAKMSKSKGNIINPDEYIDRYGVDALRMYLMFVGPYDQGGDFRDSGMVGMYRFLEKVWKLFQELKPACRQGRTKKEEVKTDLELKRKLHQTIEKVTKDLGSFKYNTAIAALMELVNAWQGKVMSKEDGMMVVKLLAPLAPYVAEELWQSFQKLQATTCLPARQGYKLQADFSKEKSVHWQPWPVADEDLLQEDVVTIVIQINGKVRSTLQLKTKNEKLKTDALNEAKEDEKVKKYIEGKQIMKEIWVEPSKNRPGIVNLVVS